MPDPTFNLLDEPWLIARDLEGRVGELPLLDVLSRAHELRSLEGDIPTQQAALLRLLVVVLRRALPLTGGTDAQLDEWAAWWRADSLPVEEVTAYLEMHRDRFDLLSTSTPFMQVADLTASKTSGLTKLIGDHPDGHQFFTTRGGAGITRVTFAEAARWLVHAQTFDPSGIKSGAHGDVLVKGGKGYPIGTGWSGKCGLILLEGRTLKETLLLNMTPTWRADPADLPAWERPQLGPGAETGHPEPTGVADLLTWQSRRIRLLADDAGVVDALITNGDAIHGRNRQRIEPHCAWRHSAAQEKIYGGVVYMPRSHDPARSFWRGLPSILLGAPTSAHSGGDVADTLSVGVLESLAALITDDIVSPTHPILVHAVGIEYGSQSSTVAVVIDDSVRLRSAVVADRDLADAVNRAVRAADEGVKALRNLADNVAAAAGIEGPGARERAGESGYAALDLPFRGYLSTLGPEADVDQWGHDWEAAVGRVLRDLADEIVRAGGEPAWIGRRVQRLNKTIPLLDSSLARIWFESALAKALPSIAARRQTTDTATKESNA